MVTKRFTCHGAFCRVLALSLACWLLSVAATAQTVTIKARQKSLKEFIVSLHENTGYHFIYNSDLLNDAPKVDVAYTNAPLETVLAENFTANGFNYVVNKADKTVILNKKTVSAAAPAAQPVKGVVLDDKGNPVTGATVMVKGTNVATTTNNIGAFTINAPDNSKTLVVIYVGYETQEVPVTGSKVLNIVLKTNSTSLDSVIVIGYGSQKKSNVSYAIASLNSEAITDRAISRVDQALVGQIAGVNVKQTTGLPGKAFSIQVRGSGSISANTEPLYVLDGFPLGQSVQDGTGGFSGGNALDNINPDDIESIEVLKDAAAAAIYGSRGSNGVVLITTKKGKVGKARIQVSGSAGYNEANRKVDMLNGEEWADRATEMINAAYVSAYGSRGATAQDDRDKRISIIGANNISYIPDPRWAQPGHPGLRYVDWQDEIFRKGLQQNYQVSASGGSSNVNYFFSVNNIRQEGIVIGTSNNLYSARANVEANFNQKLKLGINLSPSYSLLRDPGVEGKDVIFHQALNMTPIVEDSAGLYTNTYGNNPYNWAVQFNSPVQKALNQVGETKRFRTVASVYGIYTIIKGLNFKTSVNVDFSNSNYTRYVPYTVSNLLNVRNSQTTVNTSGGYQTNNYQAFVNENTLNYTRNLTGGHNLNVLLGQSYNNFTSDNSAMNSVGGYTNAYVKTLNYAAGIQGRTSASQNILLSYFSRVQYAFRSKYLFSGSIRTDGSSRFGENTRWGVFPAASVAWKMSEEPFIRSIDKISDLKLRISYGVTGNNNIGDFSATATTASYGYVFGSTQAPAIGQAPNRLPNPNLKWEKSATTDIGLDVGLFKGRITASFDYYNRLTRNMLMNVAVPEVTGFQIALDNVGQVRNKGWEIQLSTKNIVIKQLQWTTNVQLAHNSNKVVALGSGQTQILVPSLYTTVANTVLKVGESINSIYVIKRIGTLTQDDINAKVARYGAQTVGDARYEDYDRNGIIDAGDRQVVGHPNPDYTWGVTNTLNYKGFDLRVLVQGQVGGSIYSILGRAVSQTGFGYIYNQLGDYRDRWRSPENPGSGVRDKAYSTFGSIVNTDWLYSSDYLRVRAITLGYDLKTLLKKAGVGSARMFVSLENFFGKDKYYGGANPESANTDLSGNGNYPQSGDYGGLPLAKSLIVGVNLSF
ncbi:TonB-linked SusC/RagA family outer membrane protein [Filimonas zeae]|uniref:SusC/RagA family TonB-linked outer membrane protein n=1 Tax=Filimonas zeae TaxID=1737353 RepID=UPI00166738D5|nr:TonB-dependent receptor [Filimonas zeae]MDR6341378.1 TonB-linked SusC/RagA family outer membrane protein [Filimonas zeae]